VAETHAASSSSSTDVQAVLDGLVDAVRTDDPARAASLQMPGASLIPDVVANARVLGIRSFTLRAIDTDRSSAAGSVIDDFGSGAWAETVEVDYRLPQDVGPTSLQTDVVLVPGQSGSVRIAALGSPGARGSLWFEGPIQVRRSAQVLLIVGPGQSVRRYWLLARRAQRAVTAVLGKQRRPLVFEVPSDQQQLEQLIDAPAGSYDLIAGVTASIDGAFTRRSPIHSFFNSNLMQHQIPKAAQLVVSHEATLQATRAPASTMPIWVKEGFADYVALDHLGLPLRTTAREISDEVRRHGPPNHLPTQATFDFDPALTNFTKLNAVYESAWLACRFIAQRWSEATLLATYRAFDRGTAAPTVLRETLGISPHAFVKGWQRYLVGIARTAT
jgi:hypothetical protein